MYFINHPYLDKHQASLNRISTLIYNISRNPVNWIQGWASVDVVTGPFKEEASKSEKNKEAKMYTGRSTMSIAKQQQATIQGKENVGIAANSLKVYEAIAHAMYETLANGTEEEIKNLFFNMKIAGKEIHIVANAWVNNERFNQLPEKYKEILGRVDQIFDAYTALSALLSLAADNAKDPTLFKINAGPSMIGLYTAGIFLGLDPKTLVSIINSKTGNLITDLMKSNRFYNIKGFNRPAQVIEYIQKGPLDNITFPIEISTIFSRLGIIEKESSSYSVQSFFGNLFTNTSIGRYYLSQFTRLRNALRNALENTDLNDTLIETGPNPIDVAKYLISVNQDNLTYKTIVNELKTLDPKSELYKEYENNVEYQAIKTTIEELEQYLENPQQNQIPWSVTNYLNVILNANQEIQNLITGIKSNVKLNKKLRKQKDITEDNTSVSTAVLQLEQAKDLLQFLNNFIRDEYKYLDIVDQVKKDWINESMVFWDLRKLINVNIESQTQATLTRLNQGYVSSIDEQISWVSNFESIIENRNKSLTVVEKNNLIDGKIVSDYLDEFIEKYNSLRVDLTQFATNENYRKDVINLYNKIKVYENPFQTIVKTEHYLGYLQGMAALVNGLDSMSLVYRTMRKQSPKLLEAFKARTESERISLERKLQNFYSEVINRLFFLNVTRDFSFRPSESQPAMHLLTEDGRTAFKTFMDEEIFPYLIKNYGTNSFISQLAKVEYNYNWNHIPTDNWRIMVTTMPKTETEIQAFRNVKKGLSDLQSVTLPGSQVPVTQLIFLYNLIAYNGQSGQIPMTAFFEDLIAENNDTLIRSYNNFWIEISQYNLQAGRDYTEKELYAHIAPVITQSEVDQTPKYPYAYIMDSRNKKPIFLQRSKMTEELEESIRADEEQLYDIDADLMNEEDQKNMKLSITQKIRGNAYSHQKSFYYFSSLPSNIEINDEISFTSSSLRVTNTAKRASIFITQENGIERAFKIHPSHKGISVRSIIEQSIVTEFDSEIDKYKQSIDFNKLQDLINFYENEKSDCI